MIDKEEIEKAKAFMVFYKNCCLNRELENIQNYKTLDDEEFVYKNLETILQYIQQLESNNYEQNNIINSYIEEREKLIDKLEEDKEKFNKNEKNFMTQSSQINASLISYINEILSIVKDNKKTTFPKK